MTGVPPRRLIGWYGLAGLAATVWVQTGSSLRKNSAKQCRWSGGTPSTAESGFITLAEDQAPAGVFGQHGGGLLLPC